MIKALFSGGSDPLKSIQWVERSIVPQGRKEAIVVTMPDKWSGNSCKVFASHYLRVVNGVQETSAEQAIRRLTETWSNWALLDGYLDAGQAELFKHELAAALVQQRWSPNSPAWYNLGVVEKPQGSACFISSVDDDMKAIIAHQAYETTVFTGGSGTGTNLSSLRPRDWPLTTGGSSSGPTSFMRGFDGWAGITKSGGKTRRAAKLVCLDLTHPDSLDFIEDKATAERMASDLIDAGWPSDWNGITYAWLPFQNANNSVRASDAFMRAVDLDGDWTFTWKDQPIRTVKARDVWNRICIAAHTCGDPGLILDDTTNAWHTSPGGGRIRAANPCIEFCFLDDSACNLASLNLRKYDKNGVVDLESMEHMVYLSILAQEVTVSRASYPSEKIAANSEAYRPLGLGYANLGALLMERGLGYDTAKGRQLAAALTSFMGAAAQTASAKIAELKGPYQGYKDSAENRAAVARVMDMHAEAAGDLAHEMDIAVLEDGEGRDAEAFGIARAAALIWRGVASTTAAGELLHPPRNAQTTLLAPTGTISFMMDCDTTGIEPGFALVSHKSLAAGGYIRIVNETVGPALERLGYSETARAEILAYIDRTEKIEGAPGFKDSDLPVFDCASVCALTVKPPLTPGQRYLAPEAHIRMMAAVQPFLSGAISKTVNAPNSMTPEQIGDLYKLAWKLGLKSVAVYRDGCKRSAPLAGAEAKRPINENHPHVRRTLDAVASKLGLAPGASLAGVLEALDRPRENVRRRLPDRRPAECKKFSIGGHDGYFHVGFYPGTTRVGEIFVRMAKEGSTLSGMLDAWATSFSLALQWGAPLTAMCEKFISTSFPPQGFTGDEQRVASSVLDYICRWLMTNMATETGQVLSVAAAPAPAASGGPGVPVPNAAPSMGGPPCAAPHCGGDTARSGACWVCTRCGTTTGCG